MQTLVEEAVTYEKCLQKIREKYGPNVVVTRIETKRCDGLLGLFGKEVVRLAFNIQNKSFIPEIPHDDNNVLLKNARKVPLSQSHALTSLNEKEEKLKILKLAASQSDKVAEKVNPYIEKIETQQKINSESNIENIELKKLAATVEKLSEQINKKNNASTEHENIVKIIEILEENDFTVKYIRYIQNKLNTDLNLTELNDFELLKQKVLNWIAESIFIQQEPLESKEKLIALVGPTGIGKTTTLAKLAAFYVLAVSKQKNRTLDVRVITIDQYRIGAAFQIKKYCEHMEIPLTVANDPSDLHKHIDLYKDTADVICIDTTGRSPNDREKILEMQKYFDVLPKQQLRTYLVVSAVTKPTDIKEIMRQYSVFNYCGLIVTKLDETAHTGSIISILHEYKIPAVYVTNGQKVPRDITKAAKIIFLRKLKGFSLDYINENFNDEVSMEWN